MKNYLKMILLSFMAIIMMSCSSDNEEPQTHEEPSTEISSEYISSTNGHMWVYFGGLEEIINFLDCEKSKDLNLQYVEYTYPSNDTCPDPEYLKGHMAYSLQIPSQGGNYTLYINHNFEFLEGSLFANAESLDLDITPCRIYDTDPTKEPLFYLRYDPTAGEKYDCREELKSPFGVFRSNKDEIKLSFTPTEEPRDLCLQFFVFLNNRQMHFLILQIHQGE